MLFFHVCRILYGTLSWKDEESTTQTLMESNVKEHLILNQQAPHQGTLESTAASLEVPENN